jgi:hypothetical protein
VRMVNFDLDAAVWSVPFRGRAVSPDAVSDLIADTTLHWRPVPSHQSSRAHTIESAKLEARILMSVSTSVRAAPPA